MQPELESLCNNSYDKRDRDASTQTYVMELNLKWRVVLLKSSANQMATMFCTGPKRTSLTLGTEKLVASDPCTKKRMRHYSTNQRNGARVRLTSQLGHFTAKMSTKKVDFEEVQSSEQCDI
ncbi:hypothetical protein RB195_015108 [Necator americanus]|uniref:Uncharacterized protein n=1 Tax=Necator americanus TaxID=51031 RepID=A0ABR1E4T6_NECAM